jgi:deaminated glutathione amidase
MSGGSICVALGQFNVSPSIDANLETIARLARAAAERQADLLVLPESAGVRYDPRQTLHRIAQPLGGDFVSALRRVAMENDLTVVAGMLESSELREVVHNTVVAVASDGSLLGSYRKMHLFDTPAARESDQVVAGEGDLLTFDVGGVTCGIATCYDIRFPEITRRLTDLGTELVLVPTAWVVGPLKESQWEVLVRARAIENTVYVAGAGQVGGTYCGRSVLIDPFGISLAEATEEAETLTVGRVSSERVNDVRRRVPSLQHRRLDAYSLWQQDASVGANP